MQKSMVTALWRHTPEISMAERRQSRISNALKGRYANFDCDRRLASTGQRRGSDADFTGPQRQSAWGRYQLSDPRRVSVDGASNLSGAARGLAEPARDRQQDRGSGAGCDPYRDRRADRMGGARLLPPPQIGFHHLVHDTLS